MRTLTLLSIFILLTVQGISQNNSAFYAYREAHFAYYPINSCEVTDIKKAGQFLETVLHCELEADITRGTDASQVFHFRQVKNQAPVYHGFANIIINKNASQFLVIYDVFEDVPERLLDKGLSWYYQNEWMAVTIQTKYNEETQNVEEQIFDTQHHLINATDIALYAFPKDSTIRVKVFNTDPLTTAHKTYTAPYIDYNDSDVAVLNAERTWKQVTATFDLDTFWLRNRYLVPFKYNLNTSFDPVFRKDTTFDYTRHQHEFEDVMVFYHITTFHKYLTSIGFDTIGYLPTPYDAHGQKDDNSMYLPGWGLIYGTGGIDDAEDAEVIVHEYSHSLREYATPGTANGLERQAIEEGMMDYMATSYKLGIDSFGWKKFAYWDGNNPNISWFGRNMASPKIYPQALTGNIYDNSEIWSSALLRIYFKLGKTITDRLTLQTFYYLTNNLTMPQTAYLFISADSALYGGVHTETIWRTFAETHILPWYTGVNTSKPNYTSSPLILNAMKFAIGQGSLDIILSSHPQGTYQVFNNLNQCILSGNFEDGNITLAPGILGASGIYYLSIVGKDGYQSTSKIVVE